MAKAGVALIGLGMVSGTYAAALRDLSDQITVRGVLAARAESGAKFIAVHPGLTAHVYPDVEAIAADQAVDFVILTTPPNARAEAVMTLAAAGKPILMEKPVERDLLRATKLVEACEMAGVPLGIMLQHRARPVVRDLRAVLASGRLGALQAVEVTVPWWRPQTYYDAPGRGTYARDGGGVLISQAIHTLDLMLSLTGPVAQVTAMTATTGFHAMEAEDFVSAGLRFVNGAVGMIAASTASFPGRGESITLHHTRGSLRLETNLLQIDWHDGEVQTLGAATTSGAGADPMAFTHAWHQSMIADFQEAVSAGRAPMVTGRAALGVHRLIAAIEQSGRTGGRVNLERDEDHVI
jgi:UDP-N-acetyl-2-amino-2-deoxyglucuronate dehydrogenase